MITTKSQLKDAIRNAVNQLSQSKKIGVLIENETRHGCDVEEYTLHKGVWTYDNHPNPTRRKPKTKVPFRFYMAAIDQLFM